VQGCHPPTQAAQGPIQSGLECFQLLWAAVPVPRCTLNKKIPSNI